MFYNKVPTGFTVNCKHKYIVFFINSNSSQKTFSSEHQTLSNTDPLMKIPVIRYLPIYPNIIRIIQLFRIISMILIPHQIPPFLTHFSVVQIMSNPTHLLLSLDGGILETLIPKKEEKFKKILNKEVN